jgi:predicted CXXCH cytochrome family protein
MRNLIIGKISFLVAAILACNVATATSVKTPGIRGSDHDFAKFLMLNTKGTALDEICIFCHAPHRNGLPDLGGADAPLWNHNLSTATYTPYSSATLNAVPGQPNGVSKLCLGCHDGTVAIDSYGRNTPAGHMISDAQFGTGSKVIGTDLTNDHPISFVFDQALAAADGKLNDPATATILPGINSMTGTIAEKLLDKSGQLQCTSCHDVHNGQGINKLLKVNNTGSALCLTCHNK